MDIEYQLGSMWLLYSMHFASRKNVLYSGTIDNLKSTWNELFPFSAWTDLSSDTMQCPMNEYMKFSFRIKLLVFKYLKIKKFVLILVCWERKVSFFSMNYLIPWWIGTLSRCEYMTIYFIIFSRKVKFSVTTIIKIDGHFWYKILRTVFSQNLQKVFLFIAAVLTSTRENRFTSTEIPYRQRGSCTANRKHRIFYS